MTDEQLRRTIAAWETILRHERGLKFTIHRSTLALALEGLRELEELRGE